MGAINRQPIRCTSDQYNQSMKTVVILLVIAAFAAAIPEADDPAEEFTPEILASDPPTMLVERHSQRRVLKKGKKIWVPACDNRKWPVKGRALNALQGRCRAWARFCNRYTNWAHKWKMKILLKWAKPHCVKAKRAHKRLWRAAIRQRRRRRHRRCMKNRHCRRRYFRHRRCMRNKRCRARWVRHWHCMRNKKCRARWLKHRKCMRNKKCRARYIRWRKCMKNKRCRGRWLRHRRCMKNKKCRARWLRNRRCKARYIRRIRHLRCMRNRRCKAKWLRSIKRMKGNSNRRYPTFYQHCNFRGYKKSLTRSTNWVRRVRIKNDDLSSIVVPRGWVVTVYQHAHYKGRKMTIVGPKKVSCLVRNKMNRHRTWNDQISSIAVHRRGRRKRRRRRSLR